MFLIWSLEITITSPLWTVSRNLLMSKIREEEDKVLLIKKSLKVTRNKRNAYLI